MNKQVFKMSYHNTPDEVYTLGATGKMKIISDLHDKRWVILHVDQKRKNMSEASRKDKADMAEFCLNELGFETVYNFVEDGAEKGLAAADMLIEYDLHKKPYTITRANPQEIKSLQDLIKNTGIKIKITRTFIDGKGTQEERVHNTEFKQAIANYLKQNQM